MSDLTPTTHAVQVLVHLSVEAPNPDLAAGYAAELVRVGVNMVLGEGLEDDTGRFEDCSGQGLAHDGFCAPKDCLAHAVPAADGDRARPRACPRCASRTLNVTPTEAFVEVGAWDGASQSFEDEASATCYKCATCECEFVIMER